MSDNVIARCRFYSKYGFCTLHNTCCPCEDYKPEHNHYVYRGFFEVTNDDLKESDITAADLFVEEVDRLLEERLRKGEL